MLNRVTRALTTVYRSWQLTPTIELTLDWDGPLIYTVGVGEPPMTRAVRGVVSAARRRSLTLISGRLEIRFPAATNRGDSSWTGWAEIAPLERFVALPLRVGAGESSDLAIPVASLVTRLAGAAFPADHAQLRVIALDDRKAAHASAPLPLAKIDLVAS